MKAQELETISEDMLEHVSGGGRGHGISIGGVIDGAIGLVGGVLGFGLSTLGGALSGLGEFFGGRHHH